MGRTSDRQKQLELEFEEKRRDMELTQKVIGIGIRALSARMLTTITLVADLGLFAWAIASGSWLSLAAAVLFAISTYCVLYVRPPNERKDDGD
jgi:ABC-type siderophore export system fused ATPase/permease subunit